MATTTKRRGASRKRSSAASKGTHRRRVGARSRARTVTVEKPAELRPEEMGSRQERTGDREIIEAEIGEDEPMLG